MAQTGVVRVGIAGWVFEPWRGSFYPVGLKPRDELAFAAARLGTIEINATFYRTQTPASFAAWAAAAPEGFRYAVKGSRFITQGLKARDPAPALANFFASGVFRLGPKLGPLVWQLPDHLQFEPAMLERFLDALPKTVGDAERLAQRHDERIPEPVLRASGVETIRHAVEVGHASFANPVAIGLFRVHNVALVIQDTAEWPFLDLTADFVYARLKGPPSGTGYDEATLDLWGERLRGWSAGEARPEAQVIAGAAAPIPRDAFVYFVHEDKLNAPRHAEALSARLAATES